MKKFLLLIAAAVSVAFGAKAASPEVYVGYGGYTQMDATDMHDGGKVNTAWGAFNAGVDFRVMPKLRVGASYTLSSTKFKHSPVKVFYHVFMVNGKYDYYRNSIVKLYGHVGLGVDVSHITYDGDSENEGYFAFQVSPLGAEVDLGKDWGMFGEVGFGAQGLLQVGVRVKL